MTHRTRLPEVIAERPPWQRLIVAYGAAAVGMVIGRGFFVDAYRHPFLFSLLACVFFYGPLFLFALILTDLFRREYGPAQRAMVSWMTAAVAMGLCAASNGSDLAVNILGAGVVAGAGMWLITGTLIRRRLATLPPPPGATSPPDEGDWSISSLRPPR